MTPANPETVITVQGAAWAELDPEQCILSFTIAADGSERAPVLVGVTAALETVRALLTAQETGDGPVAHWSADRVHVTAQRPWTNDGSQAPIVHRASVSGRVVIDDVTAVGELIDALSSSIAVTVDALEWRLTDARLERERVDVRTRAVGEALAKAEVLAAAIGLGSVTAVALADPGMLDGGSTAPLPRMERAMMMAADAGSGFSLRPEPIRIEAAVDARFVAR